MSSIHIHIHQCICLPQAQLQLPLPGKLKKQIFFQVAQDNARRIDELQDTLKRAATAHAETLKKINIPPPKIPAVPVLP